MLVNGLNLAELGEVSQKIDVMPGITYFDRGLWWKNRSRPEQGAFILHMYV